MKRTKLMQEIAKQARAANIEWTFVRQGANHELWRFGTLPVTIPRHADINERTAQGILRAIEEAT